MFVGAHVSVYLNNVKHGFYRIYPRCVLWLCSCIVWLSGMLTLIASSQSENRYPKRLRDTCRWAVPPHHQFFPCRSLLQLRTCSLGFLCLYTARFSPTTLPICPPLLTSLIRDIGVRQSLAYLFCDLLFCPVVFPVCIQPSIKIYIFCLALPSCDSN